MYGLQYRTRDNVTGMWGEWKWLPASLTFSHIYNPMCFEFRWYPYVPDQPQFIKE